MDTTFQKLGKFYLPFTNSITKYSRSYKKTSYFISLWIQNLYSAYSYVWKQGYKITVVWKHECIWTRNGGFWARARTRFSTIVHSTSSSCIMMSFFNILMAYNSSVPFLSASITFPKEPFPNTIKKLKSVARIRSLPFIFAGTIGSCLTADFWLSVGGYKKQNNSYLKILPYEGGSFYMSNI